VTAPGPPKAIGKGLFTNAFTAMLPTERYVAGRSQNSLVTGLARQGAAISAATLTGTCAQAGALLVPLAEAITARSRDSWHLHADETSWRVLAPRDGNGPAKWWLRVFIGPDTTCFVMDPSRSGAVLARHAGIDEETGQLTDRGDGLLALIDPADQALLLHHVIPVLGQLQRQPSASGRPGSPAPGPRRHARRERPRRRQRILRRSAGRRLPDARRPRVKRELKTAQSS
jgi:hypothetical protein